VPEFVFRKVAAPILTGALALLGLVSCSEATPLTGSGDVGDARLARGPACPSLPKGTTSIRVIPSTATVIVGAALQLQLVNQSGVAVPACRATWFSPNTVVATVTAAGLVNGRQPGGPLDVTASVALSSRSAVLAASRITVVPLVNSVEITPAGAVLLPGETVQLTAIARDAAGQPLTGKSFTWTSLSDVATVSPSGLVTLTKFGTASIQATTDGVSGTTSIDGDQLIVFDRGSGDINGTDREIYSIRPDGTELRRLTQNNAIEKRAALSPDRKRIAFSSDVGRGYTLMRIWTMNRDGSSAAPIFGDYAGTNEGVSWSQDGSRLAFYTSGDATNWGVVPAWLVVTAPDGSGKVDIGQGAGYTLANPDWTVDGKRLIIYTRRSDKSALASISVTAGMNDLVQLTNSATDDVSGVGAVSPDGSRIVYTALSASERVVLTMKIDGTDIRRLTPIGGQDQMPSWSPDGKKIVFVSERSGAPNLWIMNADGSAPRQLTTGGSFDYYPHWR
jgi:Tol biopolymer transport system component